MKQTLSKILGIALLCGFFIYLLVTGIGDLTNKSDLKTVRLIGAAPILEVEHSINGLIPTGKDYYYIGLEDQQDNVYIIKGSKKWFTQNFSSDYEPAKGDVAVITGLVKRVSDYDIRKELASRASALEGARLPLSAEYAIVVNYKTDAIIKLLLIVIMIVIGVCIYFGAYHKDVLDPRLSKASLYVMLVLIIVWLVLLLRVVR